LQPSIANVLVITVEGPSALALDVASGIRRLRERADAKDEAFFQRRGFEGTRDFYHRFLRLGAVVVRAESGSGIARVATWENPSARIAPPQAALRACVAALNASAA
ncbi:MAG: hypothetical protein M3Y40_05790, partial [Chloroflexota bacterium]|nr:hypothetical protein [Chloroflexota bacterium]